MDPLLMLCPHNTWKSKGDELERSAPTIPKLPEKHSTLKAGRDPSCPNANRIGKPGILRLPSDLVQRTAEIKLKRS